MNNSSGSYRQIKDLRQRRQNEGSHQNPEDEALGGESFGIPGLDERNPFAMPSDEEVFRLRDEERKHRALERERQKGLKPWQKSAGIAGNQAGRLRELMTMSAPTPSTINEEGAKAKDGTGGRHGATKGIMQAAARAIASDRRQEKESMAEFIAKKREMFLVQMSLDTKREEIRKLEEKAQMKEEALKKSEQMLEEDAIRFDTFLKENDKKAHEAIRRAENESQLKNQKVAEIKKKNQEIAMVISEMSKHKEALDDCLKYKKFLDDLTPGEWFETQKQKKKERQEKRRKMRIQAKLKQWEDVKLQMNREAERQDELEAEALLKQGKVRRKAEKAKPRVLDYPPRPNSEDEPITSSDEDCPMYFREPIQLLSIFQNLEEQNLILIQNSQETEHALEELNKQFRETKSTMDTKTAALNENIFELDAQIQVEQNKSSALESRLKASSGNSQGRQQQLLAELNEKVKDVYSKCGFDITSNPPTLSMLSDLEARLEDLLAAVSQMPPEYVRKAEKEKEKKRREKKRLEQQQLAEKMQEERNRKAIERSLQAPKKRTGRQVMFRSEPVRRAIREDKKEDNEEDLDELKFLT